MLKNTCKIFKSKMFTLVYYNFSKSQGGKIQKKKIKSAFQLAEERRKDRGFGPSDGWTVGPVNHICWSWMAEITSFVLIDLGGFLLTLTWPRPPLSPLLASVSNPGTPLPPSC